MLRVIHTPKLMSHIVIGWHRNQSFAWVSAFLFTTSSVSKLGYACAKLNGSLRQCGSRGETKQGCRHPQQSFLAYSTWKSEVHLFVAHKNRKAVSVTWYVMQNLRQTGDLWPSNHLKSGILTDIKLIHVINRSVWNRVANLVNATLTVWIRTDNVPVCRQKSVHCILASFQNNFIFGRLSRSENIIIEHYAMLINFWKAENIPNFVRNNLIWNIFIQKFTKIRSVYMLYVRLHVSGIHSISFFDTYRQSLYVTI